MDLNTFSSVTGEDMAALAAARKLRVGWIGTGLMGLPMCTHLRKAGYPITIFSRTPTKAKPLCDLGATMADSPLIVAQRSDVVFTMLTSAKDVRQVILGPAGVLSGLRPGCVVVDSTSSEPSLAREIYDRAREKDIESIDAPVSGGDVGAINGTLAFMAGGNPQTIKQLEPLFQCMGKVTYLGPAGCGQTCKLGNQITVAANLVGLSEGLIYAEKAGLDPSLFLKAVSGGAAGSKAMDVFGEKLVNRDFAPGGFAENMVKDLGTALKESQEMGGSFPGSALSQQLFLSLIAHGDHKIGGQGVFVSLQRINNLDKSDRI